MAQLSSSAFLTEYPLQDTSDEDPFRKKILTEVKRQAPPYMVKEHNVHRLYRMCAEQAVLGEAVCAGIRVKAKAELDSRRRFNSGSSQSQISLRQQKKRSSSQCVSLPELPTSPVDQPSTTGSTRSNRLGLSLRRPSPLGRSQREILSREEKEKRERATEILKTCGFFQELQSLDDSIYRELAKVAVFTRLKEGEVLFRQGDQPKNCYVVVSGEVGIYMKTPEEMEENEPDRQPGKARRGSVDENTDGVRDYEIKRTVEGFSRWHPKTYIGAHLDTLTQGSLFGELALIRQRYRAASAKCLRDVELMVVSKGDFDKSIKADVLRDALDKLEIFRDHVPGFATLGHVSGVHPSNYFEGHTVYLGHEFLIENSVAEPAIFVLRQGRVAFMRRGRPGCPAEVCDVITEQGNMFCSTGAIPLQALEPLTVVADSPECEVMILSSENFSKLPEQVFPLMREQLRLDMMRRLKRLCVQSLTGREPMQSPRDSGIFRDFRDAPVTVETRRIVRTPCAPTEPPGE